MTNFRSAALAALALGAGLAASAASAQVRYAAPAAPAYVVPVDEVDAVPPNVSGQFTCTYNERRTRLERKNCGGFQVPVGTYGYTSGSGAEGYGLR